MYSSNINSEVTAPRQNSCSPHKDRKHTCSGVEVGRETFGHHHWMIHIRGVDPQLYEGIIKGIFLLHSQRVVLLQGGADHALTKASKLRRMSPSQGVFAWFLAPGSVSIASPKSTKGLLVLRSLYLEMMFGPDLGKSEVQNPNLSVVAPLSIINGVPCPRKLS